jgi:hypothetical protein
MSTSLVGRKVKVVNVCGYDPVLTKYLEGSIREVTEQHGNTVGVIVEEYKLAPDFPWSLLVGEYELQEED